MLPPLANGHISGRRVGNEVVPRARQPCIFATLPFLVVHDRGHYVLEAVCAE